MEKPDDTLQRRLKRQIKRMKQAEHDRPTLMGQTVYVSTLGLMFVLPVVAGVYLGHWLDNQAEGYSFRWTLSMIMLGLVVGGVNVYLLIREQDDE